MGTGADPIAGATYVLDDFTIIQIEAIRGHHVRYRARGRIWRGRWISRTRTVRLSRLKRRLRAEVNGDFFPELVLPGRHRFEHPAADVAALKAFLAAHAGTRPFAAGN